MTCMADYTPEMVYPRARSRISVLKAKFHYAILVADRSEAGRRPAASWNLAYHLLRYYSELARASRSATGLRPASYLSATSLEHVCDQDSVIQRWI